MNFLYIVAVHVWFWISVSVHEKFCFCPKNFYIIQEFFLSIFVSAEKSSEIFEILRKVTLKMSCRNPNNDDCMANDNQSYTEIFQMRTRMIKFSGQTIKRLQKLTKKKRLPIRIFEQCMLRSKSECFFFKNEWSFNQFQCNFKSNYVQIAFFFQLHCVSEWRKHKKYELKNISKESIQLFPSKSSLVNCTKIKIVAKEKTNLPACLWKKLVMSSARKLFWNY